MFCKGNFKIRSKEKGGWFVGWFMDCCERSEDIEIKYWEFEPGIPKHDRKYQKQCTEITLILKGKIEGIVEGERIKLEAGDYVMIPPRVKNGFPDNVFEYAEGITIKFPSIFNDKVVLDENWCEISDSKPK